MAAPYGDNYGSSLFTLLSSPKKISEQATKNLK